MNKVEFLDWLSDDALAEEITKLIQLTVASEMDNLTPTIICHKPTEEFDWSRLLLAASMLVKSTERKHKETALRIATAAVSLETSPETKDSGAVILDKLSNIRSVQLAEARGLVMPERNARLGLAMRLEAFRRHSENAIMVESEGAWIDVNEFQKEFWSGASSDETWLSASAPTASGKTFLVLQWLLNRMSTTDKQVAVYMAPTRALVSEIESTLKSKLTQHPGIEISSLPLPEKYVAARDENSKIIYVFTQERVHLLANILNDEFEVDLLIVDEAHKIGDDQRGVILQDAIERMSRSSLNMKAVFISPGTQNPETLLEDAPEGVLRLSVDSDTPTVLQNVILAEQVPRKPKQWELKFAGDAAGIPIGVLNLPNKPAGIRKRLAFIAAAAGERGGTLVYCNGAAEAEQIALLISQLGNSEKSTDEELLDLADLARKGVHRRYQLAPLVERGVAFHYGNMPSLIRMEIERLFRIGKIRFLACTSTLIEGVNLSCRTIVVRGPRKGKGHPMEPHDFWNLAGRAGRWGNEFQGNIICVEPSNQDAWPYGAPKRSRYPIQRETDAVLASSSELEEYLTRRASVPLAELQNADQFEQVTSYLVNIAMRVGSLSNAGLAKRHSPEVLSKMDNALSEMRSKIDISSEIATRHPGVNPLGLQSLLNIFRTYEGDVENLIPAPSESVDAFDRYVTIMKRINTHVFPVFTPDGLVPLHALIVVEWLRGLSLAAIIRKRIEYNENNGRSYKLPVLIRETMDIVEQTARFKAPKYLSSYMDVLREYLREVGREDLIEDDIDLGVALEFGVSSVTLLSLMELGLSRMSAVELYEKIARDDLDKEGCIAWVQQHAPTFEGMDIPSLIVREVLATIPIATH